MNTDETTIKLLRQDIMIMYMDQSDVTSNIIQIVNPNERNDDTSFFKVVRVADDVEDIKVDDVVVIELGKHTPPFMLNSKRYAVTSARDVLAVIE